MKRFSTTKILQKSDAIFLQGKVCQGSKNIQELFQIFLGKKNWGCFGAQVSELNFREKNEYFSFMKNIYLIILGIYQRNKEYSSLG